VEVITDFIITQYRWLLILLVLSTAFFAYKAVGIPIVTNMDDLLSTKHPYVKLDKEFRKLFGGSNLVLVQVRAKRGDIFNEAALRTIRRITDEVTFFPGVDRNKVYSIAARKVKDVKVTSWGMSVPPIMWPDIPSKQEELIELKSRIFSNNAIYGSLVSFDGRAALVSCEFFTEGINYKALFNEFQKLRAKEENENIDINLAGDPIIHGYIDHYLSQTFTLFVLTLVGLIVFLAIYTRSLIFVGLPIISAFVCGCWGLGFAGLMGYNLDPLILVIPMVITSRALSHSIQFNERLVEELEIVREKREAVKRTVKALLYPGVGGIVADGVGIILIAIIPIPLLVKLAFFCFFWAMSICFGVLVLNPALVMALPSSWVGRKARPERGEKYVHEGGRFDRVLIKTAGWSRGKNVWIVFIVVLVIFGVTSYLNTKLIVGDAKPGTPLLWPGSRYNTDEKLINDYFPGVMNPFLIVVQGTKTDVIKQPQVLRAMVDFQRYLSGYPEVGGTLSYADLVRGINMKFYEDMPKWNVVPSTSEKVGMLCYLLEGGGAEPGDYDKYIDYEYQMSNIAVFCVDRVGTTIERVIDAGEKYIARVSEDKSLSELVKFRLGAGLIALRASVNKEIARFQVTLSVLAFLGIGVVCALFFQAVTPGWMLILPLFIANYLLFGYMAIVKIGLNINTLPVASIAVGIGVDYGFYLMERIKKEYAIHRDLDKSISIAIRTTGKAIIITVLTIALSVFSWAFSSIRFQAEMGVLLGLVTIFHLFGTLIFLPALVRVVKPSFIVKQPLL
jgi:predicted RND superfamily exporter protein